MKARTVASGRPWPNSLAARKQLQVTRASLGYIPLPVTVDDDDDDDYYYYDG